MRYQRLLIKEKLALFNAHAKYVGMYALIQTWLVLMSVFSAWTGSLNTFCLCLGTSKHPQQFPRSQAKRMAFCLLQELCLRTACSQFAFTAGLCFAPEHLNLLCSIKVRVVGAPALMPSLAAPCRTRLVTTAIHENSVYADIGDFL